MNHFTCKKRKIQVKFCGQNDYRILLLPLKEKEEEKEKNKEK